MGYQPWLRDDPESTLIYFNKSDSQSYAKYTRQLKKFYEKYNNHNYTRKCVGNQSNRDNDELACMFDLIADFEREGCGESDDFGFMHGHPCVILTLNKLIGWEPVSYPRDSAPEVIRRYYDYNKADIGIHCEGEHQSDQENIGVIKYIPPTGIPSKYFPYRVMKNYHQPFAVVKFMSLTPAMLIEVECKAFAYNIIHDRTYRLGMVHFELFVFS
ncbi:unnamed protein product [Soboliphyme baturini]|uniref:Sodium/potassium-transporting ATPase subunit beta n=1 Tax=Soboliphyme baturini TaxID=241478 RepID=A0A183IKN9_9BILA|nr:unnamed protein product [Soboliphyme baturini]